jgi:hypothetical protein
LTKYIQITFIPGKQKQAKKYLADATAGKIGAKSTRHHVARAMFVLTAIINLKITHK